ncbi:MAG: hypothetical protein A3A86_02185 [Elusimicrobia bacterium RIFCSPLOWO2_01_FULL_60_11]|nr:MAG: hypothetical protein A3A86_02185 [Elusimicrobia bacterium RIFCSPLOWO2_01_FULL_60_11]
MADGDFEKTVKLTAGGASPSQDMDKTVKLTPQGQGPVKLTPSQNIPEPMPASLPSIESLLPPVQEQSHRPGMAKAIAAVAVILIILGAAWYLVPGMLMKSAAKLSAQGDHAKAAKQLLWAQSLFPMDKVKYMATMGKEMRLSSDLAGAQAALEKVLKQDPDNAIAVREMGLTAKAQGRNTAAFEYLNRAYQSNSNDSEALTLAAQIAFEMKDYKNAVPLYQALTQAGGSAQDFFALGTALKETGQQDAAVAAFQACLFKNGAALGVHKMLTRIMMEKGDHESALMHGELEMQGSPNDPELPDMIAESALKSSGNAYAKKDYMRASGFLQRGLKIPSNGTAALHYDMAKVCAKLKKTAQALTHLRGAIAADKALKIQAKKDAAFSAWRKNPQFIKIVR